MAQLVQTAKPASAAKVPAEQLKQEMLLEVAAKVPIGQLVQKSAPDESEYLPTAQTRQLLLETYLPATHAVVGVTHALASNDATRSVPHAVHIEEPETDA